MRHNLYYHAFDSEGNVARTSIQNGEELPPVCVRCGAAATSFVLRRFYRDEGGLRVIPILGPDLLGAAWFRTGDYREHSLSLNLPVCEGHKNHWLWWHSAAWLTFAVTFAAFSYAGYRVVETVAVSATIIALFLSACLTFWVAALLQCFMVRAVSFDSTGITLAGVAKEFDRQLMELRGKKDNFSPDCSE